MRRLIYITIVTLGVGSALVALFLLSQTSQNTEEFDRLPKGRSSPCRA